MSKLGEMILTLDRLCNITQDDPDQLFTQVDWLTINHLALLPENNWTSTMKLVAYKLQKKYSELLCDNGADNRSIESPKSGWLEHIAISNNPNIIADTDGFIIRFPYNSGINQAIKKIPGYIWRDTAWFVPFKLESANALIRAIQNHSLTVSKGAHDILLCLQAAAEVEYQIFDAARQAFFNLITQPGGLLADENPEILNGLFNNATRIPADVRQQRQFISYFVDLKMQMQMIGVNMVDRTIGYPQAETLAGYAAISKHMGRRLMESQYHSLAKAIQKLATEGSLENPVDSMLVRKLARLEIWLLWQTNIAWRLLVRNAPDELQGLEEPPKTTMTTPRKAQLGQDGISLYFPYDLDLIETIKKIPGRISKSDPAWYWIIPLDPRSALALASLLIDYQFDFREGVYEAMRGATNEAQNMLGSVTTKTGTSVKQSKFGYKVNRGT